ncbi:hypothetical protein CVT26_002537 [Gymnopilus dilepis]|uniref:Protoporphyrinogen oxidase n=1 Tax=Gymnopilus dilepis TaxID=231916 RepID=A0A409Y3Q5_9AGAR|nr:hypothetical protein CVT26_002537 [Gymnopilus dilepis]
MPPARIAVLGGGLTGLSSAFHLSRKFPETNIVLLERQRRLGGWVRSERVDLPQVGASVLLEAGPRTLRPNSKAVLELIHLLRLEDEVITVPKTAPPAKARFIYVPESETTPKRASGLQRLPSSIPSLISSPFLPMLLAAVAPEPFKKANRPQGATDESVDSLFSRRFGETFARTFGSALVHGIYATDSRKLSVRAAFPSIWEAEGHGRGSIVRGFLMPNKRKTLDSGYALGRTTELMRNASVYSFRNGMESLTKALEESLMSSDNVTIMKDTRLSGLKQLEDHSMEIYPAEGKTLQASHVVSALPLPTLHNLISAHKSVPPIPHLTKNPASTVRVVNLVFSCPPKDIHPEGFGYLIPRPAEGYPESYEPTSPGILGTVFDSCSLHEQDLPHIKDYYNHSGHTKLTMMTGGPYPQAPLPPTLSSTESPMIPPFIRSLLDELKVQLRRDIPDPIYWRTWNNEGCIPTLLPGHLERMEELKAHLGLPSSASASQRAGTAERGWNNRLVVVGAGVGGVSVGDCVEAGRHVGKNWT